jgi:hypothetical protein
VYHKGKIDSMYQDIEKRYRFRYISADEGRAILGALAALIGHMQDAADLARGGTGSRPY